jgi:hypothetical protein
MRPSPTPVAALVPLLLLASAASAQVRDDARFFSPQTVARANETIDRVRQQYRKTVVVETYDAVPGNLQGDLQQLGRDRFYAQWADNRMRSMSLDGLLILITKNPGRVQVGLGKATPDRTFTVSDREQVRKVLADNFRSQQYDAGLQQAMDFVYRRMGENAGPEATAGGRGAATSPPQSSPRGYGGVAGGANSTPGRTSVPPVATGRSCGMGSMLCLIIGIVVVVMLVRGVFSRRSAGGAGYGGGYGGPGMPPPPPGGVYGQPGYGQPGYGGGGGGFGRGVLGGLLGGVLGSWGYNRMNRPPGSGSTGFDTGTGDASAGGLPRTDPATFGGGGADYSSSGSDFGGGGGSDLGGGGGGSDFGGGGGGGGGGDTGGSSGSDF